MIRKLGLSFEQVVLLGYPPFLKDVIDAGPAQGIDWDGLHIRLVMAGEVFSEGPRHLVGERMGGSDPCRDSASLYGTADARVPGSERSCRIARHSA